LLPRPSYFQNNIQFKSRYTLFLIILYSKLFFILLVFYLTHKYFSVFLSREFSSHVAISQGFSAVNNLVVILETVQLSDQETFN